MKTFLLVLCLIFFILWLCWLIGYPIYCKATRKDLWLGFTYAIGLNIGALLLNVFNLVRICIQPLIIQSICKTKGEIKSMSDINMRDFDDSQIGLTNPYNEGEVLLYQITFPNELEDEDEFFEAIRKLNIDDTVVEGEFPKELVVKLDNDKEVKFFLADKEFDEENKNKRYIIEWYDGELFENGKGEEEIRKIGRVHRESFRNEDLFLERICQLDAIDGKLNIIDGQYICEVEDYPFRPYSNKES